MWNKGGSYISYKDLARFSSGFQLNNISAEAIERAKLLFLDSLTAIVSGNQTKLTKSVVKNTEPWNFYLNQNQQISLPGTSSSNHPFLTTILNGISMVSQELDEGNPLAKGHPSCHFFPVLLTQSQVANYSGVQMLEAFIIGYEISARAGAAVNLKKEIHPHGSWGLIGGGYAIGKLLNFNEEEYNSMLSLTSSFPYISLWNPIFEGHHSRDLMIGLNNFHLLIFPNMVRGGISGSLNNIKAIYSSILGNSFDNRKLIEGLGKEFYLMSAYFKFHSYCRFCHAPMEGVKEIIIKHKVEIEEIKEIHIHTYESAARLKEINPVNHYAGKFSIPFAVSSYLEDEFGKIVGTTDIHVVEDAGLNSLFPERRVSTIKLSLKNGDVFQEQWEHASGDADDENLIEKVLNKNRISLSKVFGKEKANEIVNRVMKLQDVKDFREIIELTNNRGEANVGC
ncbi:MAG TPA: MmgE/PrpD family protein [Chondromyces sp.]|nr:MmgE/PrpD family protein [Chondromyces sp.]